MLCVHGLRVLHNKHFESTLLSSNIRPILFEFCELQYLHSIPYGTTLRQNLGLNSALPFKDSDTTWDSNYSHSGWETVSCSRWHQYPRKKTRGGKWLSPTPSVSNLSLRSCRYLSTVTQSSSHGSVDCRNLRPFRWPLICSWCKGVLKQDDERKGELSCVT